MAEVTSIASRKTFDEVVKTTNPSGSAKGAAEALDLFYAMSNSGMSVENDLLLFLAQLNSEAAKSVKDKIDEMKKQANLSRMKKGIEAGFIQDPKNPTKFKITDDAKEQIKNLLGKDMEIDDRIDEETKAELLADIDQEITELNGGIPLKEEAILQAELNMAVQRFTSTTGLVSDAGKKLEALFKKIAEDFPQ